MRKMLISQRPLRLALMYILFVLAVASGLIVKLTPLKAFSGNI